MKKKFQEFLSIAGITINGPHEYDIQVHNPKLYARLMAERSLGLGESYMDGWWDCPRLDLFFHRILIHRADERLPIHLKDAFNLLFAHVRNYQSKNRAWIVGKQHYDLGNDLFSRMLDPYMQYSCGYWKDSTTLEQAQEAKLRLICEKLQLKPGQKLLDIGCGWGGLAEFAAKHYGVEVTGITISKEQQKMAQERCQGLPVKILLEDYRSLQGQFDRVVSVGMFEHVGHKNYRTYFEVVHRNLKEDGIFLLHTIGRNKTKRRNDPWIEKYIFPNGVLPAPVDIDRASEDFFVMEDWHNFGPDYDRTLSAWYDRFVESWPAIKDNYNERFYRMFCYYLNVCMSVFRARQTQLWQIVFTKGLEGGLRVPR